MRADKNLLEARSGQVGHVLNVHILTRISDSKAGLEAVGWVRVQGSHVRSWKLHRPRGDTAQFFQVHEGGAQCKASRRCCTSHLGHSP